jgi:hypothetical protein
VHIPTPTKGEIVTFAFELRTRSDIPMNAEIIRTRTDVSWEDVVGNYATERKFVTGKSSLLELETSQAETSNSQHSFGYWTFGTIRNFLISFAQQLNMDPLLPSTWYSIPFSTVYSSKVILPLLFTSSPLL